MNYDKMSPTELDFQFYQILEEVRKRLKCGVGSVAPSCCADAKREPTSDAKDEERSDDPETAAVAPGEAKAIELRQMLLDKAAELRNLEGEYDHDMWMRPALADQQAAELLCSFAHEVGEIFTLPKPESEARDERSGRRNTQSSDA